MPKKAPISPRKSPKQSRSRSLVDSAVEAAARVLSSLGYEAATTNKVAETAGISIGSLYQYFPNKDALMGAVIDRQLGKYMGKLEKVFSSTPDLSIEQSIELVIRELVSTYLGNRKLLSVIFEQLPRTQRTKNILHARRNGARLVRQALERNLGNLRIRDLDRAAYIVVNAAMGVLLTAVIDDALPMSAEEISSELIALLRGYLVGDPGAR